MSINLVKRPISSSNEPVQIHKRPRSEKTDAKVTLLYSHLSALFQTQGIDLVYDRDSNQLIADKATPSDLYQLNKTITAPALKRLLGKDNWPTFYFEHQTMCCQLGSSGARQLQFTLPHVTKWPSIVKEPPHPIFSHCKPLTLPSNKVLFLQEFVEHPLFKNTLEKYSVFSFLTFFVQNPGFQKQYDDFCSHIKLENWFESYLSDLKGLSYLSLTAFLDGKISQDDLFMIHMVASALEEDAGEKQVEITVLQKYNAEDYLSSAHYPPFDTSSFHTTKTQEELKKAKQTALINLQKKSPVQRTAIAYGILSAGSRYSVEEVIFRSLEYNLGYRVFEFHNRPSATAIVIAPSLCLELYALSSSLPEPPPSDHTWMFGFSYNKESLVSLIKGRPISIASLLFKSPYVHQSLTGKQLGITVHDLLYHLAIDWQNPHCRLFIKLAESIRAWPDQSSDIKNLRNRLLDREFLLYPDPFLDTQKDSTRFWMALQYSIMECSIAESVQHRLIPLLKEILPCAFFEPEALTAAIKLISEEEEDPSYTQFLNKIIQHGK